MKHSASTSSSDELAFLVVVITSGFLVCASAGFSAIFTNLMYTLLISWERVLKVLRLNYMLSVGFCFLNS